MRKTLILGACLAGWAWSAGEEPAAAVFTLAQAEAGKAAYESTCISCHGETLIPPADAKYQGQRIPPLAGPEFVGKWGSQTTGDLSRRIRVAIGGFPPKGSDATTHLILTAYVLQINGARAGSQELTDATAVPVAKTVVGRGAR
jgi:hypothetical protein